jgi:hypothetical protein
MLNALPTYYSHSAPHPAVNESRCRIGSPSQIIRHDANLHIIDSGKLI